MLRVATPPDTIAGVVFTFMVPGREEWVLRSVIAHADRQVGGVPNRAYLLEITDGTTDLAAVGAPDLGTEPGTCSITWGPLSPAATASGPGGVVVAPLPGFRLLPGYLIVGTIQNPAGGDQWASAAVWLDFDYTA